MSDRLLLDLATLVFAILLGHGFHALALAGVLTLAGIRGGLAFALAFAAVDAGAMHFAFVLGGLGRSHGEHGGGSGGEGDTRELVCGLHIVSP